MSAGATDPQGRDHYDPYGYNDPPSTVTNGSQYPPQPYPPSQRSRGYEAGERDAYDRNGPPPSTTTGYSTRPQDSYPGPNVNGNNTPDPYNDYAHRPSHTLPYDSQSTYLPPTANGGRAGSSGPGYGAQGQVQVPQPRRDPPRSVTTSQPVGGGLGGTKNGDHRFSRNGQPVPSPVLPWKQPGRKSHSRSRSPEKIPRAADQAPREPPTGPSRPTTPAQAPTDQPQRISRSSLLPSRLSSQHPDAGDNSTDTEDIDGTAFQTPDKQVSSDNGDGTTELSSLARLREFKESVASSRSKNKLLDVDAGALEEMAASFLASASAVPPTPVTVQASQLAPVTAKPMAMPTREELDNLVEQVAAETSAKPVPTTTAANIPSTAPPAASSSADATIKTREQELKERLKAKRESSSPSISNAIPPGISAIINKASEPAPSGPSVKAEPGAKGSTVPTKRDRLEEGEIADEESKRMKIEVQPPSTAGTTGSREDGQVTGSSDGLNSAGKRKRADAWMKTTGSGSVEPSTAADGQQPKSNKEKSAPYVKAEKGSLESRISQDTGGARRDRDRDDGQASPRGKGSARGRHRSRSPAAKNSRAAGNAPAGGFKDSTFSKNRQEVEERVRSKEKEIERERSDRERDRESKPSLAERIGLKDHSTPSSKRQPGSSAPNSASQRDSYRDPGHRYDQAMDNARRSRSPPRQSQATPGRGYEAADRGVSDRRPSMSSVRPDQRGRDSSPYAASRAQGTDSRDRFRDDRGRHDAPMNDNRERPGNARSSVGGTGYQDAPSSQTRPAQSNNGPAATSAPAPAPAATPTAPLDSVAETLSLLKAQIARLESQIPGAPTSAPAPAQAPAPAPAPLQTPKARYPSAASRDPLPSAGTAFAQDTAKNYRGDLPGDANSNKRFTPRRDYDRPPSPRQSLPNSRYDHPPHHPSARSITPLQPAPLHAHTRDLPPSRYNDPAGPGPRYPDRERERADRDRDVRPDYPPRDRDDRARPPVGGYDNRAHDHRPAPPPSREFSNVQPARPEWNVYRPVSPGLTPPPPPLPRSSYPDDRFGGQRGPGYGRPGEEIFPPSGGRYDPPPHSRDPRDLRDARDLRGDPRGRDPRDLRDIRDRDVRDVRDTRDLRDVRPRYPSPPPLGYGGGGIGGGIGGDRDRLRDHDPRDLRDIRDTRDPRDMRDSRYPPLDVRDIPNPPQRPYRQPGGYDNRAEMAGSGRGGYAGGRPGRGGYDNGGGGRGRDDGSEYADRDDLGHGGGGGGGGRGGYGGRGRARGRGM